MITPLEIIDFGIAAKLEDVVSSFGLWPNINNFLPVPVNELDFQNAIQLIRDSGKIPCPVYHPGDNRSKDEITDSRIDIRRNYFEPGTLGFGNTVELEPTNIDVDNPSNNRWNKVRHQNQSFSVEYEIRYYTKEANQHRFIDEIIASAFGIKTNIQCYNRRRERVEGNFDFYIDGTPTEIKGSEYIERMYRYQARDVYITQPEIIRENVVPINCISIEEVFVKEEQLLEPVDTSEIIGWDIEIV